MSHWRNILFLILLPLGAFARAPQIQGIPTPTIYQGAGSSYDGMSKYVNGAPLNGLRLFNIAHLGAKWANSYSDRSAAFGVIAFDNMVFYSGGAIVNGLNGPEGWAGAYVDRINAFPAITFDNLTNYAAPVQLSGLNLGNDNGAGLVWSGAYVDGCPLNGNVTFFNNGGYLDYAFNVGAQLIFVTFDGTAPSQSTYSGGLLTDAASNVVPPAGTYQVNQFIPLPFSSQMNYTVTGPAGLIGTPPCQASTNVLSLGVIWSNNVVANGGAAPSVASVTNINNFAAGLNADGTTWNTAQHQLLVCNAFAPDSLIATLTPQIYVGGAQPWINHGPFVSGDLSVNGLTGNGSSKYLDTGFTPITQPITVNSGGLAIYAYNNPANANTYLMGVHDSAPSVASFALNLSATPNMFGELWSFTGTGNTVTDSSPANGFYGLQRTAANSLNLYFASSVSPHASVAVNNTAQTATMLSGGRFAYVFALNNNGGLFGLSSETVSFVAFDNGFNASQDLSLYTRVQTLRTAFGGGFR